MRLRRQITTGLALLLGSITIAVLAFGLLRSWQEQAEASFTRLARQEHAWRALQATLAEDLRNAAQSGQSLDLLETRVAAAAHLAMTGQDLLVGLERVAGRLLLVATQPLPDGGVLAAGMAPDALLARVTAATGAMPVLTDAAGRPQVSPAGLSPLAAVADRLRGLEPGLRILVAGDRLIEVATVPFRDGSGEVIGARRWLNDVTERRWIQIRNILVTSLAVLVLALAAGIGLVWWLRRAFRPLESVLAAQHALAAGDLSIELRGQDRPDEIGRAARALQVFRESHGELRRMSRADARQKRIRLRFIEAELGSLAATMDAGDKAAMEQDLRQVMASAQGEAGMDALALAFHVMSERVRSQHQGLRGLIEAQRDALDTKTRMEGLQQELAAVATMQARMVPAGWPAEAGAAVGGRLFQGAQYGGDLQDFFWLDGPQGGRLAVLVGSVHGTGLAAVFLAISVRALVRALAPQAASPGACLSRVSDLLLGDNTQRMEISAFLGIIDLRDQTLVAARAAAPPPLLLLRPGEARVLEMPGAPPMGLKPGLLVPDTTIDLPSRAALVAVSHGLPLRRFDGQPLGMEGLAAMLARSPGLEPDIMLEHMADHLAKAEQAGAGDASLTIARPHAETWQPANPPRRNVSEVTPDLQTA